MATATSDEVGTRIVNSAEWLAARKELLAKEKEFTRLRDELSRKRREMPWERVERLRLPGAEWKNQVGGAVRRAQPAHRVSLYVWSGVEGRVSELLVSGGHV